MKASMISALRATAFLGLLVSGPTMAAAAEDSAEWQAVIAAAKAEGQVSCYCSSTNDVVAGIAKIMQERYGIQVNISGGRGNEVAERVRSEQAAGRFLGDVVMNSTTTLYTHNEEHALAPIPKPLPRLAALPESYERHDTYFPAYNIAFGLLINTDLVPESEEPKSWNDLLDPKWSGKIILDDPRAFSAGGAVFRATTFTLGRDFAEKFAAQKPVITVDFGGSERRVALGEFPIMVPGTILIHLKNVKDGSPLPIKFLGIEPGIAATEFSVGLLKNAPHPNAARLLMNEFLSVEGQLTFVDVGYAPVMPDAIAELPEDLRKVMSFKTLKNPPVAEVPSYRELAAQIYGATNTNR